MKQRLGAGAEQADAIYTVTNHMDLKLEYKQTNKPPHITCIRSQTSQFCFDILVDRPPSLDKNPSSCFIYVTGSVANR